MTYELAYVIFYIFRSVFPCLYKPMNLWYNSTETDHFNLSLEVIQVKVYTLKRHFNGYKKGTHFYLIAESEFIGVKGFVLRTQDLTDRISINESEFLKNFTLIKEIF